MHVQTAYFNVLEGEKVESKEASWNDAEPLRNEGIHIYIEVYDTILNQVQAYNYAF